MYYLDILNEEKLWRAPELLRIANQSGGTQKGDVYSFAIILYEIFNRRGPWGNCNILPKGTCINSEY